MLGLPGPAQPSPTVGDALNAGYSYLEVRRLGCYTHQTVALDVIRRPKTAPIHELERYTHCRDCCRLQAIHISAATNEGLGERSALDLVARRTLMLIAAIPTS